MSEIVETDPAALLNIIDNLEAAMESIREERDAKVSLGSLTDSEADTIRVMLEELEECRSEALARMKKH